METKEVKMPQEKELKRVADALERIVHFYEHPEELITQVYQETSRALSGISQALPQLPSQVSKVEVTLSPEAKEEICKRAMADFEEQMAEFRGFIAQSLAELPEATLKRIGEHLKEGRKFKLRRKHGCIYLDFGFGDEDFYLRL